MCLPTSGGPTSDFELFCNNRSEKSEMCKCWGNVVKLAAKLNN